MGITDSQTCLHAAQWLGVSASRITTSQATPRPYGCYWDEKRNLLMINTNEKNRELSDIATNLQPICASTHEDTVVTVQMQTSSAAGRGLFSLALFSSILKFCLTA